MSLYQSHPGRRQASRSGSLLTGSLIAGLSMMLAASNLVAQEADDPSAPPSPPSQPQASGDNPELPEPEQNNQTDQQDNGQAGQEDNRAWLGVRMDSAPGGVLVLAVQPGSAAATAGLQPGDVILRLAETSVRSPQNVIREIDDKRAGDDVSITVLRNGQQMQLDATLESRAQGEQRRSPRDDSDQRHSMRRMDLDDSQRRLQMLEKRLEQLEQRLQRFEGAVENADRPASDPTAPPQPGIQQPGTPQPLNDRDTNNDRDISDSEDLLPQADNEDQSADAQPGN